MPRVGVYLRLSREDEGGPGESQSIENQRRIVSEYLTGQNWSVAAEYVDDGFSGMKTERPAFRRLLRDIEAGRIDTVVTKDLSRLGRDYLATGEYLERYFPEHGVRYIAVGDHIDTAGAEGAGFMTPLLSVFNDLYARDISRKVRAALNSKKAAGQFIGARPPYGYRKDAQDRGHLVPDPETAPTVRWMFRRYAAAGSVLGLAKALTRRGVPTPAGAPDGVWNDTTVRRILTNPTYAGHLTQNRSRKVSPKSEKRARLPRSDWIVVTDTHTPLVTEEEFSGVQELLGRRGYRRADGRRHVLSGLVFCADCGGGMSYARSGDRTYLVCQRSRRSGELRQCTSHCVREDAVEEAVRTCLRTLAGPEEWPDSCPLDFETARLLIERVVVHADRTLELYVRFRLPEEKKGSAGP